MAQNEITLKVAEALSQRDIGQGIARLDPKTMNDLGINERDLIEITGEKKTAAIALPSQTDIGLGVIRIDGLVRKNSGATIGGEVTIKKAQAIEAKKVVLAPTENNIRVQGDVRGLFQGKAMVQGDIIGSQIRTRPASMGMGFDSIFNDLMDFSPMKEIKFAVVSTKPAGIVVVGPNTEVELHESPVDVSNIEGVTNLVDVSYEDIGGLKEEVKKVREMIEIPLKRPELFDKLGIAPPKGVLMHGPPGTGKTLLAKAVASESDAHFIAINGPEIMSKYVGGSEENLREYFEEAEENAPSIIFIDELDAIAPKREDTQGETERRTVAQLLTLMDGLKSRGQVVVIGATNRPDSLDQALRRPGRFDREIEIGVPDAEEREEILEIHTRNMPLAEDVDLKQIAQTTAGFTGADLENLMNEAAIRAAGENREYITQDDIRKSFVKVGIGAEKKSRIISDKEKRITAYHEAGHAILFHLLPDVGPVYTVSIIPTGAGAAGYTMPLPEKDEMFNTKGRMLQEIVVDLGGRVAEELVFDDITTGASQDIKQATKLAREMVTKYGMSDNIGLICYADDEEEVFIGRDLAHAKNYSEGIASAIDVEVKRIIDESYDKAKSMIAEYRDVLDRCAALLLEKEKITRDEFEALFDEDSKTTVEHNV